ncbi:hypothetical protein GCM10009720_24570 [Yaniella flava]|uniref:Uncharacterized protein n=1 Tax=Yaniella flava TaxID=287930 RepID=A0ABN2USV4_9MICC
MPGKVKAAVLGAVVGVVIVVLIELMAVVLNDEVFFGTDRSWITLAVAVVALMWVQMRAYDQKKGIWADKDAPSEQAGRNT